MRERTASVNGALDIESDRGSGTRLTVEIPL
jgi:signal transduction histidine kinase